MQLRRWLAELNGPPAPTRGSSSVLGAPPASPAPMRASSSSSGRRRSSQRATRHEPIRAQTPTGQRPRRGSDASVGSNTNSVASVASNNGGTGRRSARREPGGARPRRSSNHSLDANESAAWNQTQKAKGAFPAVPILATPPRQHPQGSDLMNHVPLQIRVLTRLVGGGGGGRSVANGPSIEEMRQEYRRNWSSMTAKERSRVAEELSRAEAAQAMARRGSGNMAGRMYHPGGYADRRSVSPRSTTAARGGERSERRRSSSGQRSASQQPRRPRSGSVSSAFSSASNRSVSASRSRRRSASAERGRRGGLFEPRWRAQSPRAANRPAAFGTSERRRDHWRGRGQVDQAKIDTMPTAPRVAYVPTEKMRLAEMDFDKRDWQTALRKGRDRRGPVEFLSGERTRHTSETPPRGVGSFPRSQSVDRAGSGGAPGSSRRRRYASGARGTSRPGSRREEQQVRVHYRPLPALPCYPSFS